MYNCLKIKQLRQPPSVLVVLISDSHLFVIQWLAVQSAIELVSLCLVSLLKYVLVDHPNFKFSAMSNRSGPYERRVGRNTHQRRASSTPSAPADGPQPPPSRPPPSVMASTTTNVNRNILLIVDFSELARLARPFFTDEGTAHYYRMLHPCYYESCNSFESEALYSHSHLVLARDVHTYTIEMILGALVEHILTTFLVEVDPATIELRSSDREGDLFRVPRTQSLLDLLDSEFPMWRSVQQGVFRLEPIQADIDYPFVARFSCHISIPGVILP